MFNWFTSKFPYTNFHELNLDWILNKVKFLEENQSKITTDAETALSNSEQAVNTAMGVDTKAETALNNSANALTTADTANRNAQNALSHFPIQNKDIARSARTLNSSRLLIDGIINEERTEYSFDIPIRNTYSNAYAQLTLHGTQNTWIAHIDIPYISSSTNILYPVLFAATTNQLILHGLFNIVLSTSSPYTNYTVTITPFTTSTFNSLEWRFYYNQYVLGNAD